MVRLKRTTHSSRGISLKQMEGFSLLSHKASATAINNRLTGSQFRLWHYLMMIDPFADQTSDGERIYHDIPSPDQIGLAIGTHARTVEKDMARLEDLGLYAKRVTGWQGYNLSAEEARNASAAMKQAKAERTAPALPVEHPKCPEPLQDKGGYLTGAETQTGQGEELKPLQDKGGYLTGEKIVETHTRQAFQRSVILPQSYTDLNQTYSDSPLTPQGEPEGEGVEVLLEDEGSGSGGTLHLSASLTDQSKTLYKQEFLGRDQSSRAEKPLPSAQEPADGLVDDVFSNSIEESDLSEGEHSAATMQTPKTDPLLGIGTQSTISLQRQRAQASIAVNYQFNGPWETPEQFQSFQEQLYEYAKQEGKPSLSEWVFKIIDGITKGIHSPLWDDFKAGRRLGSADGKLPIHRVKRGPNGINPDFAEYVRQWMIGFRKSDVPLSEAIAYIIKREPGGYLESEWPVLLAKAQEWYESLATSNTPTEGEMLANELAIVLNSPQAALVEDRFEKVNGKYKWETQPGEPIPALLDWYSKQIKLSKRPELSGKPAMVIARVDFRDRFLAASIYEEWRKYAKQLIGNHDMQIASIATQATNKETSSSKTEASSATVDVTPNPISMKEALVPSDPEKRIKYLQEFYDISGIHKVIVRGWLKDNLHQWGLEIVKHKIQEIPF